MVRPLTIVTFLILASAADAAVTRVEIQRRETFAGPGFGNSGSYERIVGRFHGELDPEHPLNKDIILKDHEMLDRMKDLGNQISTKASEAAVGIKSTVKSGVEGLTGAASDAATTLNEKAIRTSVEQLRTILAIATDELKTRPIVGAPATMTASVSIGGVALEIQVTLSESTAQQSALSEVETKRLLAACDINGVSQS